LGPKYIRIKMIKCSHIDLFLAYVIIKTKKSYYYAVYKPFISTVPLVRKSDEVNVADVFECVLFLP
jgi:hypothetical protein